MIFLSFDLIDYLTQFLTIENKINYPFISKTFYSVFIKNKRHILHEYLNNFNCCFVCYRKISSIEPKIIYICYNHKYFPKLHLKCKNKKSSIYYKSWNGKCEICSVNTFIIQTPDTIYYN